jgi:hypothetical protein
VCCVKFDGTLKGKNGPLVTSVFYATPFLVFSILATNCVLFEVRAGEKKQAGALVSETDCLICYVRLEAQEKVV